MKPEKNTAKFEKLLARIDHKLDFLGMNPLNEASEMKKFFKQPGYNPVFRYAKAPPCDNLLEKISRIDLEENLLNRLLIEKSEKFRKTNAMIKHVGKEEFTVFSKEIFGTPDEELVNKSYKVLKEPAVCEENLLTSKQVVDALQKSLSSLGLSGWKVNIRKMAANAAVLHSRSLVCVRKNCGFSAGFLKQLIVHEIGAHVFRATNGAQQQHRIFATGLPDYLMTEEGLAVNMEEQNDCLRINTLRSYAGRVLAIDLSLNGDFRYVYDELRKYFDERMAWNLTLRAKRGLSDTTKPGGYTKDHLYLKGYYEVKDFLVDKGREGLKTLYYGRIGLQHVNIVKQMEGLIEPKFLPDSEIFKSILKEL